MLHWVWKDSTEFQEGHIIKFYNKIKTLIFVFISQKLKNMSCQVNLANFYWKLLMILNTTEFVPWEVLSIKIDKKKINF